MGDPLRDTVCLLERIQSHGSIKNKVLSFNLVQSLNIER